ncbi:MAG: TatD family hydrolase [Calditerrivibrio sp.]|nr:TatD family hydrolase [Calditerrivibrio sp.]
MIIEKKDSFEYKRLMEEIQLIKKYNLFFTDTHAHIHFKEYEDIHLYLKNSELHGVKRVVTIGIDLEDSLLAKEVSTKHEHIYFTLGFHPHDAKKFSKDVLIEYQQHINDKKMLAIGEIGLDFYRNLSDQDTQIKVFEYMLEFARINNKPIIIHNRDASEKVMDIISNTQKPNEKIGIIHCFNGDKLFLKWALDFGFYISYAGPITFKKEDNLRETITYVPIDRLFVETDCPYLTPLPFRGEMNEPAYVVFNAYTIAFLKKIPLLKTAEILEQNFNNLFRT